MTLSPSSDGALPLQIQRPDLARSLWQIVNSFVPYIAICAVLYAAPGLTWWMRPMLWVLAAGFMVRIFIIQHDCGHGSFFRSRRRNELLGWVCSIVTMAPYAQWRRHHAQHHASWNNLDKRGEGIDIYTTCMTVDEYSALSKAGRVRYRLMRNPLFSLILLPPLVFLALYRIPFDSPRGWQREKIGVHLTNLAIVAQVAVLSYYFGFLHVLSVMAPISIIAATVGVWLFSVQHRFENTLWTRQGTWSPSGAALQGCSYLKLPRVLQWFTGNIGFHHVHHFNPRIPNYRLEHCHRASTELQRAPVLSLRSGLITWRYALWDESAGLMVPFPRLARTD